MLFEEFCTRVTDEIEASLGEGYQISCMTVRKNNNCELKGLTIRRTAQMLSPTIYLDPFYSALQGGVPFETVIERILGCYEAHKDAELDVSDFTEFDRMKGKIALKLINRERNEELLMQVPHRIWNDLAIVYCCLFLNEPIGSGSILIRNEHMKLWNTDEEKLHRCALLNAPKLLPEELKTMEELLSEMMPEIELPRSDSPIRMYVLGNREHVFGASALLYSEKLRELSGELDSDLYVIPSSVHEVILIPAGCMMEPVEIQKMIREVNESQVEPDERLSDTLYFYSRDTGEVKTLGR